MVSEKSELSSPAAFGEKGLLPNEKNLNGDFFSWVFRIFLEYITLGY